MRAYGGRYLTYSLEQPLVIKHRLANLNDVTPQLTCIADQPCCMGQCANRSGTIVSSHAAKLIACDQRGLCSQVPGPKRSYNTGRPRSNHDDIEHVASASWFG